MDDVCLVEMRVLLGLCVATTALFSVVGCNAGAGKEQKLHIDPAHNLAEAGMGMGTVGDVL